MKFTTLLITFTTATALYAGPIGPTPYLSFNGSPWEEDLMHTFGATLEDFEGGKFYSRADGNVVETHGATRAPSRLTDSVDADDGKIDGHGNGWSYLTRDDSGVTFVFDAAKYGGYPRFAGAVATDGCPCSATFYDENGNQISQLESLAVNFDVDTTDDDRLMGLYHQTGIASMNWRGLSAIELDHLQFAGPMTATRLQGDANGDRQLTRPDLDLFRGEPYDAFIYLDKKGQTGDLHDTLIWFELADKPLGDFNWDGSTDFSDFLTMSRNYGTSVTGYDDGDITGDRRVNFDDFLLLSKDFGKRAPLDPVSVPEPTSFAMLGTAIIAYLRFKPKRHTSLTKCTRQDSNL